VRPKVLFRLGLASGRLEDWNTAERALSELARGWPDFAQRAEAELWRGRALLTLGRERPAIQAFERAVAADAGRIAAQARLELGRIDQQGGRHDEALSQFLKVALLYGHEQEVAEALFRAGECLAAQGAEEQALEQWRELCREHPETSWAKEARRRLDGAQSY
jgi:TolA-binding protein